jgi:hypothetical protein
MWKVAPLKSSFMLVAMLGFMITIIYTAYGRISQDWGFALGFLFAIMFIASLVSMTKAPFDLQLQMAEGLVKQPVKKKAKKRSTKRKKK